MRIWTMRISRETTFQAVRMADSGPWSRDLLGAFAEQWRNGVHMQWHQRALHGHGMKRAESQLVLHFLREIRTLAFPLESHGGTLARGVLIHFIFWNLYSDPSVNGVFNLLSKGGHKEGRSGCHSSSRSLASVFFWADVGCFVQCFACYSEAE